MKREAPAPGSIIIPAATLAGNTPQAMATAVCLPAG
jgi:hypothetical protein